MKFVQDPLSDLVPSVLVLYQARLPTYRNRNQPWLPETMLHSRLKGVGATELRVDDDEPYRPVDLLLHQSLLPHKVRLDLPTVIVKPTSSRTPATRPACRNAYGWPVKKSVSVIVIALYFHPAKLLSLLPLFLASLSPAP